MGLYIGPPTTRNSLVKYRFSSMVRIDGSNPSDKGSNPLACAKWIYGEMVIILGCRPRVKSSILFISAKMSC